VAQAIPTHSMGVFKVPASTCEELTQFIRKLWWGEEGGKRKVHWVAWEKQLASKCKGGMGFRDMQEVQSGPFGSSSMAADTVPG
jgi:hypothetical protein